MSASEACSLKATLIDISGLIDGMAAIDLGEKRNGKLQNWKVKLYQLKTRLFYQYTHFKDILHIQWSI